MLEPDFRFEKGQWLRSRAVGVAPAFVGEVVFVDAAGGFVRLRDGNGRVWHRDRSDLSRCWVCPGDAAMATAS